MSSVWDFCVFDAATSALIQNLENSTERGRGNSKAIQNAPKNVSNGAPDVPSSSGALRTVPGDWNAPGDESGIDGLQSSLVSSEQSCRSFMQELDSLLHTLGEVAALHEDVTSRTNSLMFNCENLLEQQVCGSIDNSLFMTLD